MKEGNLDVTPGSKGSIDVKVFYIEGNLNVKFFL